MTGRLFGKLKFPEISKCELLSQKAKIKKGFLKFDKQDANYPRVKKLGDAVLSMEGGVNWSQGINKHCVISRFFFDSLFWEPAVGAFPISVYPLWHRKNTRR